MKMSKELYAELVAAMSKVHTPEAQAQYRDAGLSDKRYRWDVLWAAQSRGHFSTRYWLCDVAYKNDLNDDHIDTAIRRFMQEVATP